MKVALQKDARWNLGLAALLIVFAASVAFAFLSPKPATATDYRSQLRAEARKAAEADVEAASLKAQNLKSIWTQDLDRIAAVSLENVSKIAKAKGVRLVAFRPQRAIDSTEIQHLPFLTIVEGGYPAMVGFLRALETPALKLAVNSVQVTASDGSSDHVTASIVLVAFRASGNVVELDGKGK